MVTKLVLLFVICVTQNSFRSQVLAASDCSSFVRRDAWDIPGNNIGSARGNVQDYTTCCGICQGTPGCTAFVYSSKDKLCWPKTGVGFGGNQSVGKIAAYSRKYTNSVSILLF